MINLLFTHLTDFKVHTRIKCIRKMSSNLSGNNNLKVFRALVIAGSDIDQELYQEQLRSMSIDSCATECMSEAQKVIDAVAEKNILMDLVVIDCAEIDSTHEDFIATLRNYQSFKDTIILAAIDGKANDSRPISKSVDETFIRPISPSLFEEKVETLLNIHGASSENLTEEVPSSFGLDILIAEDNEVNQIVFSEVLNDLGANFKIAENGQEAVDLWKSHNPAIVLMDVSMPIMSGHEATIAIRTIEKENGLRHTPICAITAHALKGDRDDCIAAGMDDYLSKPVSPDMMAEKIRSLLPNSHPLNGTFALASDA